MPHPMTPATTQATRIKVGSSPKWAASPPATPPSRLSVVDRVSCPVAIDPPSVLSLLWCSFRVWSSHVSAHILEKVRYPPQCEAFREPERQREARCSDGPVRKGPTSVEPRG